MTTANASAESLAQLYEAGREPIVVSTKRTTGIGIFLCVLALLNAGGFGLGSPNGSVASFDLAYQTTISVPTFTISTRPYAYALGALCLLMGILLIARPRTRWPNVFLAIGIVATIFCLLMWAQRNTPGQAVNLTALLFLSVQYSTIIIFGTLSGTMCERSGVVNIAIEGQFLGGAFVGAIAGSAVANAVGNNAGFLVGAFAGMVFGGLIGATLAVFSLKYGADQIIVGIVLVAFVTGLTNYLNFQILNPYPNLNTGIIASYIPIPLLDKIPLIGPALFDQNLFAYAADVLVMVISFGLFRTRWGLRVRSVGEHPKAAETVGLNVIRTRYRNVIIGGAIAGLGGAYYTLGSNGQFAVGMTSGLGYIALAAMIFGRWRPYRALGAALLFGTMEELQIYLQTYNTGISSALLSALPYVVTIAVVSGLVGRVRPPAADGVPYTRE